MRRTRIASAFSLEVLARGVEGTTTEYTRVRPLLEAACEAVRRLDPSPEELLFHLAAVALLQGARDETGLVGPPTDPGSRRLSHVLHAAERTPHSRLQLAWVTARHAMQVIASRPLFHAPLNRLGAVIPESAADTRELHQSLADIGRLVSDPVVGPEAQLRRGVLTFLMREPGEGLEDFTRAVTAQDGHVVYLAHLMLGVLHERAGRADSAIAAYRRAHALAAEPSAVLQLSAALFLNGQATEAGELATKMRSTDYFTDPWHLYGLRDYRFWPEYRNRLRQMVRALGK